MRRRTSEKLTVGVLKVGVLVNKQPHVPQPQSLAAELRGHILTGSTASS